MSTTSNKEEEATLTSVLLATLKDQTKVTEVIQYLASEEIEDLHDINLLKENELEDLLSGITPVGRRAKVRSVLEPLICIIKSQPIL